MELLLEEVALAVGTAVRHHTMLETASSLVAKALARASPRKAREKVGRDLVPRTPAEATTPKAAGKAGAKESAEDRREATLRKDMVREKEKAKARKAKAKAEVRERDESTVSKSPITTRDSQSPKPKQETTTTTMSTKSPIGAATGVQMDMIPRPPEALQDQWLC